MPGRTDLHVCGILTEQDVKRHIRHPVPIPAAATRVRVVLSFSPAVVDGHRNLITLTLFDRHGFRGAGHRHGDRHVVEIGHDFATPGYLPGPLPAGTWIVQLDTHLVMPGAACPYELSVAVDQDEVPEAAASAPVTSPFAAAQPRVVVDSRAGWYRGDLHAHTVHSDGAWEVADLVAAARARGLDFVTLTDHNTTSGLGEMARHAGAGLLTMGGQELTTYWGHALCLGSRRWWDWQVTRDGPEMSVLASRIYAAGALYIIAHPRTIGDPHCTGCRWVFPGMMPGTARLVEVWNGEWFGHDTHDRNEAGLRLWYGWLNAGHRVVATCGTDVHGPDQQYRSLSTGFNAVYADELSEQAILRGVAAGHLYLSAGPRLAFTVHDQDGAQGIMGDTVAAGSRPASISLATRWEGVPGGASLRLIADGATRETTSIGASGTRAWHIAPPEARWYLLEVRAADGAMLALTNPIFCDHYR